jgi:hypothetical protein
LVRPDELYKLREEATALDQDLSMWQNTRCPDFNPRTVAQVGQGQGGSIPGVGSWPGRVDAYFDLYVAGVWNTSRTARLLLISLLLKLSNIFEDIEEHTREQKDAHYLVEDIIASIPYHLSEDLNVFFQSRRKDGDIMNPGRPVGGLLLMHPIYIASALLIVPRPMREYMRECLAWIGINMGIGQALILAKVKILRELLVLVSTDDVFQASQIEKQYFADGSLIVWTGMLV